MKQGNNKKHGVLCAMGCWGASPMCVLLSGRTDAHTRMRDEKRRREALHGTASLLDAININFKATKMSQHIHTRLESGGAEWSVHKRTGSSVLLPPEGRFAGAVAGDGRYIDTTKYQMMHTIVISNPPSKVLERKLLEHTGNYQWCSMKVRRAN